MGFRVLTVAAVLLGWALPAIAQESVKLQFNAGQVTLSVQNAPVRVILAEWARLGGATIVNGDRVAGPPVTLELTGVPERQALDVVLRSVAGYILAPRRAGSRGASEFDRILVLPTSVAPRNPPAAAVASGVRPPFMVRPPTQPGVEPLNPDSMPDDAKEPGPAGVAPTPTNPFGSLARPGVVTPVPRQQQQQPGRNRVQ